MMKRINTSMGAMSALYVFLLCILISSPAPSFAAPATKLDPVNENYPAWDGVLPKNYITGRPIVPSDLRHRVTIVVEFQMEKLEEQLPKFSSWISRIAIAGDGAGWDPAPDWMHKNVHYRGLLLLSNRGQKFKDALARWDAVVKKLPKGSGFNNVNEVPVYNEVTFEGAPDAGGKYPFVYVMGLEGKEPLFKSPVADVKYEDLRKVVMTAKKDFPEFKPFFGSVGEPQFFKALAPAIEKGKPLMAVQKSLLSKLKANTDEGKEAQKLYDALEQTRSDLLLKIRLEASSMPFCAIADYNLVGKYWPKAKKEISDFMAKYLKDGDVSGIGEMYTKLQAWSDPNLKLKKSQAKDIKSRLEKFKKALVPLKESKNITVQNSALMVDGEIDTVLSGIDAKVQ